MAERLVSTGANQYALAARVVGDVLATSAAVHSGFSLSIKILALHERRSFGLNSNSGRECGDWRRSRANTN